MYDQATLDSLLDTKKRLLADFTISEQFRRARLEHINEQVNHITKELKEQSLNSLNSYTNINH